VAKLSITLKKGLMGKSDRQRAVATSLGLTKKHQTVEHDDTPVIRGMLNKVLHMVCVDEGKK
jgi:large subunit ribosomal protein L30